MMAVTVRVVQMAVLQAVAVKTAMTANTILPHMDLSAVIQPGMNMVLIVPHWKVVTAGIAQAVIVLVTVAELMVAVMVVVNAQMVI